MRGAKENGQSTTDVYSFIVPFIRVEVRRYVSV